MSRRKAPAPGEAARERDAESGEGEDAAVEAGGDASDEAGGEGEDAAVEAGGERVEAGGEAGGSAATEGEKAVAAAPVAMATLFGHRVAWSHIERGAEFAGWASLLIFIWAAFNQLNQWQAAPFVLLFYGALLGAIVASYAARRGALPGGGAATPRRVLWGFVIVLMLWFWVPPSRYGFFWLYRRVAVYLLS